MYKFLGSFVTHKGVAKFKSALTTFFSNSGTVGRRNLKFKI